MTDIIENNEDSTKDKILNTALMEFAKYGKAGARVDRIAEAAEVNKAMIYYHFKSKDNLYYEVLSHHIGEVADKLLERVSGFKSLEEVIGGMVEVHLNFFKTSYFKQFILRELAEENSPVIKMVTDKISQSGVPNIVYNKLLSEAESGRVRNINVKQAMASLIAMNLGVLILAPIMSRIMNITDFQGFLGNRKEAVVDLFLNGVLEK